MKRFHLLGIFLKNSLKNSEFFSKLPSKTRNFSQNYPQKLGIFLKFTLKNSEFFSKTLHISIESITFAAK